MRNRAKCRLCGDIIESFHPTDSIGCKCGHISVEGGSAMRTSAIDYANFLRVDDLGNEIIVQYQDSRQNVDDDKAPDQPPAELSTKELIQELDALVKYIDQLPKHEKESPVNYIDLYNFMLVILAILKKGDTHEDKAAH